LLIKANLAGKPRSKTRIRNCNKRKYEIKKEFFDIYSALKRSWFTINLTNHSSNSLTASK